MFSKRKYEPHPIAAVKGTPVTFIHINKTGGTSIRNALNLKGKKHYTVREIQDLSKEKQFEKSFKFSFVRNPWDKVYSHYKYRVKMNKCNLKERPLEFNDWIAKTYGEDRDYYYFNNVKMFMPQVEWLKNHDGVIDLDFIGRFESLNEDFHKLMQHLNVKIVLPHLNKTENSDYRTKYNEESIRVVKNWFAEDLDFFKYEF